MWQTDSVLHLFLATGANAESVTLFAPSVGGIVLSYFDLLCAFVFDNNFVVFTPKPSNPHSAPSPTVIDTSLLSPTGHLESSDYASDTSVCMSVCSSEACVIS